MARLLWVEQSMSLKFSKSMQKIIYYSLSLPIIYFQDKNIIKLISLHSGRMKLKFISRLIFLVDSS